mmetsp:Transcript_40925/g.123428  ORF Transcript_40925/g.123428 Transcript_40925/m.123428 type:complete len:306 (-) Transcript_40925:149-1066(-)
METIAGIGKYWRIGHTQNDQHPAPRRAKSSHSSPPQTLKVILPPLLIVRAVPRHALHQSPPRPVVVHIPGPMNQMLGKLPLLDIVHRPQFFLAVAPQLLQVGPSPHAPLVLIFFHAGITDVIDAQYPLGSIVIARPRAANVLNRSGVHRGMGIRTVRDTPPVRRGWRVLDRRDTRIRPNRSWPDNPSAVRHPSPPRCSYYHRRPPSCRTSSRNPCTPPSGRKRRISPESRVRDDERRQRGNRGDGNGYWRAIGTSRRLLRRRLRRLRRPSCRRQRFDRILPRVDDSRSIRSSTIPRPWRWRRCRR